MQMHSPVCDTALAELHGLCQSCCVQAPMLLLACASCMQIVSHLLASASFCHSCAATKEAILSTSRSACALAGHVQTVAPLPAPGAGPGRGLLWGLVLGVGEAGSGMFRTGCGSLPGCADVGPWLGLGSVAGSSGGLGEGLSLGLGEAATGMLRIGCGRSPGCADVGSLPWLSGVLGKGLGLGELGLGLGDFLGRGDRAGACVGEGLGLLKIFGTTAGLACTGAGEGSGLLYLGP
jgi:hypothetical protein